MNAIQEKIDLLHSVALDEVSLDRMLDKLLHVVHGQHREKLDHLDHLLRQFEEKYHMDSMDFQHRFEAGQMGDAMDFFEWSGLVELREQVRRKLERLESH